MPSALHCLHFAPRAARSAALQNTHTVGSLTWFWLKQQQACLPVLLLLLLLFPSPPIWIMNNLKKPISYKRRPIILECIMAGSGWAPHFVCKCSLEAAASAADCDRAKLTAFARTSAAAASSALRSMFSRAHCRPCCKAASYESYTSHLVLTVLSGIQWCCEEHQCFWLQAHGSFLTLTCDSKGLYAANPSMKASRTWRYTSSLRQAAASGFRCPGTRFASTAISAAHILCASISCSCSSNLGLLALFLGYTCRGQCQDIHVCTPRKQRGRNGRRRGASQ